MKETLDFKNGVYKPEIKIGDIEINNAVIEANYFVQIFDTSVTLKNCRAREFSAAWFGAKANNPDNYEALQKAIDSCIASGIKNLYIPAGNYKYSKPLKVCNLIGNYYASFSLNIYGEGGIWSGATTLTYTSADGFGLGFQYAKGCTLKNIKLQGEFISPHSLDAGYYNISLEDYNDPKCEKGYSGLVIDYDGTKNLSGSTGITVENVWIDGYDVCYNVSANGKTFNADILTFNNIRGGNSRIIFQSNQAQEKGNVINGLVSWGNVHTLLSIGNSGKYQAGSYTVNGGNIAGSCIRLFNINLKGWNAFKLTSLTAEDIGTLGIINTGDSKYTPSANLIDLRIRFALPTRAGIQTLLTTNNKKVKITDSALWYYGMPEQEMIFKGFTTFENCNFSGKVVSEETKKQPLV